MTSRNRNRFGLILIVLLFAAPFVAAWLLHESGWAPSVTRNYGQLLDPPQDLTPARFILSDGKPLAWKDPAWSWTILALTGPDCAARCIARLDELRRVRLTLNQNMNRVRVVVLDGSLSAPTLAALAPVEAARDADETLSGMRPTAADQVAVAFADPHGFLVLRYPVDYDANKLRKDLARLIRN